MLPASVISDIYNGAWRRARAAECAPRRLRQGRLRCLGSPGRLKARYGGALCLEVQAGAGDAAQAALAAWAAAELGAELQARAPFFQFMLIFPQNCTLDKTER